MFWEGFPQEVMGGRFEITGLAPIKNIRFVFWTAGDRWERRFVAKSGMLHREVCSNLADCQNAVHRRCRKAGRELRARCPFGGNTGRTSFYDRSDESGNLAADSDFISRYRSGESFDE